MSQSQPRLHSTESKSSQDALITAPTAAPVELRQNNPQDCANLIAASVDRATVEISRTIIALNATFSQQLQQASISASNGIKSAQNSASSSISIVSQNASSATSSASFSLNLANLAVTSVNSALTNANIALASAQSQVVGVNLVLTSALSASTSDVLRLSSSLSSLEATLVSVKASASTAVALAVMSQQSLNDPQVTATISLAPIVLAGIVVGTMLASVFLSFAVGFLLIRSRNKEKIDSFRDRGPARDPKLPLTSTSMAFRTGNSVVIKFSPPTSVHDVPPAHERHGSLSTTPSASEKNQIPIATVWDANVDPNNPFTSRTDGWPLKSSFADDLDGTSDELWSRDTTTLPHNMSAQKSVSIPDSLKTMELQLYNDHNLTPAMNFTSLLEKADDMDKESGVRPIREHTRDSSYGLAVEDSEQLVPAAEALEDPFKDPFMEPYESLVDGVSENSVEQSTEQLKKVSSNAQADDDHLEELVGQEAKILWNKPDETLLGEGAEGLVTREFEDLTPEPAASSPVIVADTQNYGAAGLPEQSGTTSQRRSSQCVRTTPPEQTQEHVAGEDSLSGIQATVIQSLPKWRDGTISPLRRNLSVGFLERRFEPQSPAAMDEEREVSPLRRNPPFEPFEAIISILDEQQGGVIKLKEGGADEYESRGRSMIRTSDIIEARLSGLAQATQSREETPQQRGGKDELDNLRPASPAPPQRFVASDQAHRMRAPPKRKSVGTKQIISNNGSSRLTSNSLSRPVSATSAAVTPRRDESSPLRRNPPGISPNPRPVLDTRPSASSNAKEFSQALSKFQTLVSQNPQDAVVASNEVTSRAIAGIYIPGSLREQAVRNLSKSRERALGKGKKND
ncbi:hypothetical protein INS49_002001 [Diaporthe citri]|uniref:uncharacterized protein n=1 Tax=Diaporthe citri TaxID=83186 RepID=UPI001C8170D5|nr:uncharacterized protein INS49_002001 [Diaporthe citri]KAG6367806.1 hypothetical protein INS49_002001 [Diaporthe citri]